MNIDPETLMLFGRLALAVFLGALIGIERELAHKPAGVRTHGLVALGAALFTIISKYAFQEYWGLPGFDPSRIASQVVVGVGFMGAGIIIFNQSRVRGLTTAAGLWVSSAIGMATGFGLFALAVFATVLALIVFVVLWFVGDRLIKRLPLRVGDDHETSQ